MRHFFSELKCILLGIVDQITDQAAYRRHLAVHGVEHSGAEWRRFCDEAWKAKERRSRCC